MTKLFFALYTCFIFSFHAKAAEFTGIGDLPGGLKFSEVNSIAGNGLVVVGHSKSFRTAENLPPPGCVGSSCTGDVFSEAVRWDKISGLQKIGTLYDPNKHAECSYYHSSANDVSDDGSVIVGGSWSPKSLQGVFIGAEGFYWSSKTGIQGIGVTGNVGVKAESTAHGVSPDGRVLLGSFQDEFGWQGYLFSRDKEKFFHTGSLSRFRIGIVRSMSADRRLFVGSDGTNSLYPTSSGGNFSLDGVEDFTNLFKNSEKSYAVKINRAGTVILGNSYDPLRPYLLTLKTSAYGLPTGMKSVLYPVPGFTIAIAYSMSEDGKTVGGMSCKTDETTRKTVCEATVWFHGKSTGVTVSSALSSKNVSGSWITWNSIENLKGISADGLSWAGNGVNSKGEPEGFWIDFH